MQSPPPIDGEVIRFDLAYAAQGLIKLGFGLFGLLAVPVFLFAAVAFCPVFSLKDVAFTLSSPIIILKGVILLLSGGGLIWKGWYDLHNKPYLVLAPDRLRWVVGRRVAWEALYDTIDRVALFKDRSCLTCLGIQLHRPSCCGASWQWLRRGWERMWARWTRGGFDLAVPLLCCSEPHESVVEAIRQRVNCYKQKVA